MRKILFLVPTIFICACLLVACNNTSVTTPPQQKAAMVKIESEPDVKVTFTQDSAKISGSDTLQLEFKAVIPADKGITAINIKVVEDTEETGTFERYSFTVHQISVWRGSSVLSLLGPYGGGANILRDEKTNSKRANLRAEVLQKAKDDMRYLP